MLVEILSWFCFLAGGFLCISGSVGILRLPDFFSRLHASSVTETLATPLLLTGVMLQTGWSLDTLKLMMVWLFVLSTNPTATHAMVKAALHDGQTPLEFDQPKGPQTDGNESTEEETSTS
jgi:multicomponent Na+:H+ antiporter subunit G